MATKFRSQPWWLKKVPSWMYLKQFTACIKIARKWGTLKRYRKGSPSVDFRRFITARTIWTATATCMNSKVGSRNLAIKRGANSLQSSSSRKTSEWLIFFLSINNHLLRATSKKPNNSSKTNFCFSFIFSLITWASICIPSESGVKVNPSLTLRSVSRWKASSSNFFVIRRLHLGLFIRCSKRSLWGYWLWEASSYCTWTETPISEIWSSIAFLSLLACKSQKT